MYGMKTRGLPGTLAPTYHELEALGDPDDVLLDRDGYDESADLADLAAAYLVGFARSQGFRDGNKRTGLATALVILALNGAALHVNGTELYTITMAVATNQAGDPEGAAYLRGRLPRRSEG